MTKPVETLIDLALNEDLPNGDLTTDSLGIEERVGWARVVAKEDLILSGSEVFEQVIRRLEPAAQLTWHLRDGEMALAQMTVATYYGNLVPLLKTERVALNFLGHLSGIATYARCFSRLTEKTACRILDTRKTTPGMRALEKQAVAHGRGVNHRMNLSESILLKENHLRLAGGLRAAVEKVRQATDAPIAVEVTSAEEALEAAELGVRRILFDHFSESDLRTLLPRIPPTIETEVSGNINLDRVEALAATGVHFLSVGAITHSAPVADLSLLFEWEKRESTVERHENSDTRL